ncbi:hypothetical protein HW555_011785 [Spodoptera exigua]|uniref:Uncharacterized protein n=1 Tax=Spodoptera exigua TaxID=7107 RepID=A0A835L492_SPOEX|nr:hypothetical protein HW555_011785 [Spodoptera exigua]
MGKGLGVPSGFTWCFGVKSSVLTYLPQADSSDVCGASRAPYLRSAAAECTSRERGGEDRVPFFSPRSTGLRSVYIAGTEVGKTRAVYPAPEASAGLGRTKYPPKKSGRIALGKRWSRGSSSVRKRPHDPALVGDGSVGLSSDEEGLLAPKLPTARRGRQASKG